MIRVLSGIAIALVLALTATAQDSSSQNTDQQHPTAPAKYDPTYEKLAHQTGGQVLYLDRSDAAHMAEMMEATYNRQTIALLDGLRQPGTLEAPVDSFTKTLYLTFIGSEPGSELKVIRPSGVEVQQGQAGVRMTRLARGFIVALDSPDPGIWRASYAPRGVASLQVTAKTDLFVATFEFVELRGRIGHEGYFKINGPPRAGTRTAAEFTCSDKTLREAGVVLLADDGRELSQHEFHRTTPASSDEYFGHLTIPGEPFRVLVRGTDVNGQPFQRVYAPLFTPAK